MKIRFKIVAGFALLSIMLAIAGFFSIYELKRLNLSVHEMLEENYKSIIASKMMLEALEREDSGVLLYLLGKQSEGSELLNQGDSLFSSGLTIAQNNLTETGEDRLTDELSENYRHYREQAVHSLSGISGGEFAQWYLEGAHRSFLQVKKSVQELMDMNQDALYKGAGEIQNRMVRSIVPGIVAIISSIVFLILFNYLINHFFISPILRINRQLRRYERSLGPFNADIETRDEIKDLESSIQDLITRLR